MKQILVFKIKFCAGIAASIISLIITSSAFAEMSYGSKFLITTSGGCAVGGVTGYALANRNGYDPQPKKIITWMGATTGCLTAALFSYFFYEDKSDRLNTKISEQQKTIQDLSIQLASMQGQKQNGTFGSGIAISANNLPNPFDSLEVKEGIAAKSKFNFDSKNPPSGLNIRSCDRLWKYSLTGDGNNVENINEPSSNKKIIAVSKNFALVGFTFLYSPQDCFSPSVSEGLYAENFFPGLTQFLEQRIRNWTAENSETNNINTENR